MLPRGNVLGAGEHHVLEQVREPGPTRLLVLRADVVPDGDRRDRRGVILGEEHGQPVRQHVLHDRNGRDLDWRGRLLSAGHSTAKDGCERDGRKCG